MLKKIFRILIINLTIFTALLLIIIIAKDIIEKYINKKLIADTYQTFSEIEEEKMQENEKENKIASIENNKNDILGIIKIEDIDFEGIIYEGTTQDILKVGVGHFEDTPNFDGNVCLAAHNTNKFWAKLKNLKNESKIIYTSYLGKREYEVFLSKQIEETDFTLLKNTEENIITLITCVKGKKEKRLCVQAGEI